MIKWSSNLLLYSLNSDFSSSCIGKSQPKSTLKSWHETILADLNWYTATTHLGIILTDNTIKYTCIWPLLWCNTYKPYNSSTPLQWYLIFYSPVKEKGKQWRLKGLTMAQWINFNQNNRSVLASQYSVLWEKLALFSYRSWVLWQAGRPNTGGSQNF